MIRNEVIYTIINNYYNNNYNAEVMDDVEYYIASLVICCTFSESPSANLRLRAKTEEYLSIDEKYLVL